MIIHAHKLRATHLVLALGAAIALSTGCAVGPNYRAPSVTVPSAYRAADAAEAPRSESTRLGDQRWSEVFQDEQLQELIQTALQKNFDVRIAAARILQAEAQLGVTRADQFPTLDGGAEISSQRTAQSRFSAFDRSQGGLILSAAGGPVRSRLRTAGSGLG